MKLTHRNVKLLNRSDKTESIIHKSIMIYEDVHNIYGDVNTDSAG